MLRRVTPTLAFADVRLCDVHLCGLRIEEGYGGALTIAPPARLVNGRSWPHYSLQPHARTAIEREITRLWLRTAAHD
jgi:hypothetical protein